MKNLKNILKLALFAAFAVPTVVLQATFFKDFGISSFEEYQLALVLQRSLEASGPIKTCVAIDYDKYDSTEDDAELAWRLQLEELGVYGSPEPVFGDDAYEKLPKEYLQFVDTRADLLFKDLMNLGDDNTKEVIEEIIIPEKKVGSNNPDQKGRKVKKAPILGLDHSNDYSNLDEDAQLNALEAELD